VTTQRFGGHSRVVSRDPVIGYAGDSDDRVRDGTVYAAEVDIPDRPEGTRDRIQVVTGGPQIALDEGPELLIGRFGILRRQVRQLDPLRMPPQFFSRENRRGRLGALFQNRGRTREQH